MRGPLGAVIGRYPSSDGNAQMGGIIKHNRKCRDVVFLVLFIAFWVAMIVNSSFGFNQGNPLRNQFHLSNSKLHLHQREIEFPVSITKQAIVNAKSKQGLTRAFYLFIYNNRNPRCESLLQPGFNCTFRIEKNRARVRRRSKKPNNFPQNNVVYKCHFCSHWNLKRGTPKGHMREICHRKAKPSLQSALANPLLHESANPEKVTGINVEANNIDEIALPAIASVTPPINSPATPLLRTRITWLEAKKRKRNKSASKKPPETDGSSTKIDEENAVSTSSKRRRKSWTSLKEIAESGQPDNRNITNLTIPLSSPPPPSPPLPSPPPDLSRHHRSLPSLSLLLGLSRDAHGLEN